MRYPNENKFDRDIGLARQEFPDVPVWVIKAVIATESCFDPGAYNPELGSTTGASRGLMQVTEQTARGLGFTGDISKLKTPTVNIYYGTKLLSQLYKGDWRNAVSAYNGGYRPHLGFGAPIERAGVRCMGRIVPVGEYCNQKHVDRFMKHAKYFAAQEGARLPFVPPVGTAYCAPPIIRKATSPAGLVVLLALGWIFFGRS
jgi:hypothetical protein